MPYHRVMSGSQKKRAIVLSGGGARGAYQAGIIHYLRSQLPPHIAHRCNFDILCGSSVGAINVCFMAASSHNLEYQGKQAYEMWANLQQGNIYLRDVGTLTGLMKRTMFGVISNIFRRKRGTSMSERFKARRFRGLLDTSPFPYFLKRNIPWKQIRLNIQNGLTKAVSVTATNVHTGKMELFVDKHESIRYTGRHPVHFMPIEPRHAMASSAIPVLFPAVRIRRNYYSDGGLRQNTPLSPAIQLGADKALVIGLHHRSEIAAETEETFATEFDYPPTLGELMGHVLKSLFVDRLDYDLEQTSRINQIIDIGYQAFGEDFLKRINAQLHRPESPRDINARGLKSLSIMSIFPSRDIRQIFIESVMDPLFVKKNLSYFERTLLSALDVDLNEGSDFLSFILFVPSYINRLLDLGYEDARAKHDQLIEFFET